MCVGGVFSEFLVDSCVCKVITEGAINVGGSIDDGWAYFFVAIDDKDVSSGSEVVNCLELAWQYIGYPWLALFKCILDASIE